MSYVKKEFRTLLENIDINYNIPSFFNCFVDKKRVLHNLIIKSKNSSCRCTNCNNTYILKCRVNEKVICPSCKNIYLVKSDRLLRYVFKDNLQYIDKINDYILIRTFELISYYNRKDISYSITEFMRTFVKGNYAYEFVSDVVSNHMGYMYVNHYSLRKKWKCRNRRWSYGTVLAMVAHDNIDDVLKNTNLKYTKLSHLIKRKNYVDIVSYLTNKALFPSFEYLIKFKLFKLADDADSFKIKGNFEEIFGIPKSFYKFMKKHDLNYDQLNVLKLLKKRDIKLIKKLTNYSSLQELSSYAPIDDIYYNVLKYKNNDEYIYLDYLRFADQLGYDIKNKKILYPNNVREEHDRLEKLLEEIEEEKNNEFIKMRYASLEKNIFKNKKYIVFPADSVNSLITESEQQKNCVKTYASRYSQGKCDLYFMRKVTDQAKSLVTIEVVNNKVIQSRQKYNESISKEQQTFIDMWERNILNVG